MSTSADRPAELPVAAPDHAEPAAKLRVLVEHHKERVAKGRLPYAAFSITPEDAAALLAERQQDKERIERLEAALERIAETDSTEWHETHGWQAFDFIQRISSAALAGEEDTENG